MDHNRSDSRRSDVMTNSSVSPNDNLTDDRLAGERKFKAKLINEFRKERESWDQMFEVTHFGQLVYFSISNLSYILY